MGYTRSLARKTFDGELQRCTEAIRAAHVASMKSAIVREYVLSNAILRSSALIERYLEDVISDWVASLNSSPRMTDTLPLSIRVRHVVSDSFLNAFRRYIVFADEVQFSDAIAVHLGTPEMAFFSDGAVCPNLDAERLYQGKKFPSTKNMRALFARLGIHQIFQKLGRASHVNMELLLESFNDVRNGFAHEGMPVGLNVTDIRKKLRDAQLFVHYVDRIVYRHVCSISGSGSWKV